MHLILKLTFLINNYFLFWECLEAQIVWAFSSKVECRIDIAKVVGAVPTTPTKLNTRLIIN